MGRPTIRDLSNAAGVSISTVNRVLAGSSNVREMTMQRVLAAAEKIGFYGVGSLYSRVEAARPKDRFAALLLQPGRLYYRSLASHLEKAAAAFDGRDVGLRVEFTEDLSPDRVARRMVELGSESEGLAVVSAEHPFVSEAIERLNENGVPVIGLISPLSAKCNVGYVGLDNWKVGRTAGWTFHHMCRPPGKVGILVGNLRYRCQDDNESGFRSYFREHDCNFTILEPLSTYETSAVARELTERLIAEHSDLVGIYVAGGGITGTLAAIRDNDRSGSLVVVGHDLFDSTKAGLLDGSLTVAISNPVEKLARETIATLIRAKAAGPDAGSQQVVMDFEINTPENV